MAYASKIVSGIAALSLIGCGSGSETASDAPVSEAPAASSKSTAEKAAGKNGRDTDAPTLAISEDNLTVGVGAELEFDVTATDPSGFGRLDVTCEAGEISATAAAAAKAKIATQVLSVVFTAPAKGGVIKCRASAADSLGNSGDLEFTISVNPGRITAGGFNGAGDFNGTWISPCYNNDLGYSVRQTLTLNGASLKSQIESFTAGSTPSPNCALPGGKGLLITTDVTADLTYRANRSVAGCANSSSQKTQIDIRTLDTSGNPTATSAKAIADTLNFVTGFVEVLPKSTNICLMENGNLLFAEAEYTRAPG